MPVLARVIEAAGIPTVTVTMMPVFSEKYHSSRFLGVEFPYGHSFGMPHDLAMQTNTLRSSLELLTAATGAETRVDLDTEWPVDRKEAYKNWQPAEPSPIVAHSIAAIRAARKAEATQQKN